MANAIQTVGKQSEQIAEMKNAIVKRIAGTALAFPEPIIHKMLGLGLNPDDLPVIQSLCLLGNVPVSHMQYRQNVSEISRLAQMVTKLGYRRVEDYDIVVREANQDEFNEDGTPKMDGKYQARSKQPTVTIQITAARQVENAKADGRANGVQHIFFTDVIEDTEKAKEIFLRNGLDERLWCKDVVVARCTVKTLHPAAGLLGEQSSYGFYLPMKLEERWDDGSKKYVPTGKVVQNTVETGKQKDNYHPANIAKKRAMTSAARQITRTLYARNDVPVANNVAAVLNEANVRITEMQDAAAEHGVTLEHYIDHGAELEAQAEEGQKIIDEQIALNTISHGQEKKADQKKTVTSSTHEDSSSGAVTTFVPGPLDEIPVHGLTGDEYKDMVAAADKTMSAITTLASKECPELAAWAIEISAASMTAERQANPGMLAHLLSCIREYCESSDLDAEILVKYLCGLSLADEVKQEPLTILFKALVKEYDPGDGLRSNKNFSEEKVLLVRVLYGLLMEVKGS